MRQFIKRLPVIGPVAQRLKRRLQRFGGSRDYWEQRYADGGTSGSGSYEELAAFKAEVLNTLVERQGVGSVLELGCGDGNQLELARYPSYVGVDVSRSAVERCRARFADDGTKRFILLDAVDGETAELALSLDVIYHLVEDAVFEAHMQQLFAIASRFVVVYSTDDERAVDASAPHVRHRRFSQWISAHALGWQLHSRIPNRLRDDERLRHLAEADFFIYART